VSQGYRYIVRISGVRGGNPAVEETQLTRAQIYECLAYYDGHCGEIDLLVARQMAPSAE
jgi:uncharacterized protein (DUF433 family)